MTTAAPPDTSIPAAGSRAALAVETSGRFGGLALTLGDRLIETVRFSAAMRHAREIVVAAEGLLARHGRLPGEVEEVFVSGGPGSFTGLRVGITFARMMALAVEARVVRVPTLDVIAQNALRERPPHGCVAVILDAKRGRVFAAAFEWREGRFFPLAEPTECDPATFLRTLPRETRILGEGVGYHLEAVRKSGLRILSEEFSLPEAEVVWRLGRERARKEGYDARRMLVPIYIRPPEAEEKWAARLES